MSSERSPESSLGWSNLQRARYFIKTKYPFFYVTVLGLIPEEVDSIGTMFVTLDMLLGVDMVWFGTLETDVAAGCLLHEAMHILRGHIPRMERLANQEVAGIAFDIPINDDLKTFGIKLPDWVVYSDTYGLPKGLSGEKYYELLMALPKLPLGHNYRIGSGRCGSCSGENTRQQKEVLKKLGPGRSVSEVRYFQTVGRQALRDHLKGTGRGRGNMPGSLKEVLEFDGTEEAVVPWQAVIPGIIGNAVGRLKSGHSDYSRSRISKRSFTTGIPRPGLVSHEPIVFFIEDSSGSMQSIHLRENRIEFMNAMRQLGFTEVWFMCADTKATMEPRLIRVQDLVTLPSIGRGGTDFRPAIEKAMKFRPRPDFIAYSTDGGGAAPERKPIGVEFLWLLAPGGWTTAPCKWGIQVLTSNDEDDRKKYTLLKY